MGEPYHHGLYYYALDGNLHSGPPHNFNHKSYGSKVNTGGRITVVVDFEAQSIAFKVNGVDLGVAYKGLPTGPLHPAVILYVASQGNVSDFFN